MHQKITYLLLYIFIFNINNYALSSNSLKKGYIEFKKSNTVLEVEIADTKKTRRRGLMFRKKLESNKGMLFIFTNEKKASIWMKNTLISLDIIFISKNKLVTEFINKATPYSEDVYTSKEKIKYILEINSGMIEELDINIGDKIKIDY